MSMQSFFVLLSLAACILAYPQADAAAYPSPELNTSIAQRPSVTIANGTVIGTYLNGIDSFYGIPYAEPPVGNLRLRRPQPHASAFPTSTFAATGVATACPQPTTANFSANSVLVQGEDCLSVTIQRPAGTRGSSKLPVLFWIYGGGFEAGSTQQYDATEIINQSVALEHPILFVAVNYRVNGFGFLAGREVLDSGETNLGLRDQRLALKWVQENIEAFGGDPEKVTLFGESAGALSTFSHTVIEGGNNTHNGRPLFHGAIMNSGTVMPVDDTDSTQAQLVYDQILRETDCTSADDTLQCLRDAPYQVYWDAVNTLPIFFSYSSLALPFLPRPDPNDNFYPVSPGLALEAGNYTRIPIIAGDQQDEGTLFAQVQYNITDTASFAEYMRMIYPSASQTDIEALLAVYPEDLAVGSPFGTGSSNVLWSQSKRMASLLGDVAFTLRRRIYLSYASTTQSAWSFLDSHRYQESVLGTYHSSDVEAIFNTTPIVPTTRNIIPAKTFRNYYISFVNYLEPNALSLEASMIYWPQYSTWNPTLLNILATGNTLIPDDFRQEAYELLEQDGSRFKI